jgi:Tol biopolymer transport system component/DNA-binding winged helix-turn-helix (wHTH) protein
MQKLSHQTHSFDEFTLDLTRGCLLRGQEEIKLRPKAFDVLSYLIENQGRLVSKDELIKAVWPDSFVTDDSLVQCLMEVRRALGDEGQQIIKTVPRRGYIFDKEVRDNGAIATYTEEMTGVHVIIEEETTGWGTAKAEIVRRGDETKIPVSTHRYVPAPAFRTIAILALGALIVAVVVVMGWRFYAKQAGKKNAAITPRPQAPVTFQNVEMTDLTRTGNIVNAAISPDGQYAVYVTHDAGRQSLWLRQIATDATQQIIAPAPLRYYGVSFSRDGSHIIYARAESDKDTVRGLYSVAVLGGVPEKLLSDLDWCPSFSPDGSQLTFVRNSDSGNESTLMIANADGSNERKLASRGAAEPYTYPAWSPDGRVIAASAGNVETGGAYRDVVEVRVADGAERTLTAHKWYWIGCVAWLADGSGLVMDGNPEKSLDSEQLWLLSYANGEARKITNDSNNYTYVSVTSDSRTMLARRAEKLTHLWLVPGGDVSRARQLTSGLGYYNDVRWTPDGKLLVSAFENNHMDLWLRDPSGNLNRQLTANAGTNWGQTVSPDGRFIIFDSDRTGDFHIWRIDIDGSNPVRLTKGGGEKFTDISPDGQWVVYTSFHDWTLWKVSIDGGVSVQLTNSYAREEAISPDGKWIAYCTLDHDQYRVALIPFSGGAPVRIFDLPSNAPMPQHVRWSPDGHSLLFTANQGGASNVWQQPLDGEPPRPVTNFTADRTFSYDWTRDGKDLALVRGAWTSDMILLTQK